MREESGMRLNEQARLRLALRNRAIRPLNAFQSDMEPETLHSIISMPLSRVRALMRFANSGVVAKHGK